MQRRRASAAIVVVLGASALGACGVADDRAASRATVERFADAQRRGDGAAACALLGDEAVRTLVEQEGGPCRRAVRSVELGGRRITRVKVYITSAKVDLAGAASAFLDREPEGWRLSAVGCRPSEGKPADRPLDCELDG